MMLSPTDAVEELNACCWSTVSLPRERVAAISAEAAAHGQAALVVSCQRQEAYSLGRCGCAAPARLTGLDALVHLAEVAAGLHSVVLGEREILGQVRSGLRAADPPLRAMGELAVAAARELRQETRFESHAGHLLDRALRLAGISAGGRVLVVGTGQLARLVAGRATALGFGEVILAGRTVPAAMEPGWRFITLGELRGVGAVDVAVGCLGSGAPGLGMADLPPVRRLLLDLGTPRNFEGIPAVPSLMIADLLAAEQSERPHAVRRRSHLQGRLRELVEGRLARYSETGAAATILRLEVERTRQRELERARRLHPEIPEATLDLLTRSLVNQLLHRPTERLRGLGDARLAHEVAALFAE